MSKAVATSELLLSVRDLCIRFTNKNSESGFELKHIAFQLHRSETLGIVGESGSGKSITSLALMGLLKSIGAKIVGGSVDFHQNGKAIDLIKLDEQSYRKLRGAKISMIFQEPMTSLNPSLTCGFQVAEILKNHRTGQFDCKQKVLDLFRQVKLPRVEDIYQSYPHQLSGGQRQRVIIAIAIACNPDIIIADEPTTALDVTVQQAILELLKELQQQHQMGLIFISHDLGVIGQIADKVLVMQKGRVVEYGQVDEILNAPKENYTKALIACRPKLENNPRRLPTVESFEEGKPELEIVQASVPVKYDIPLLEINNLKTYFGSTSGFLRKHKEEVRAVDDVSFQVFKGETLGLVGESGCGKSTLGRSIVRLINPTSGQVIYKGREISKLSATELRALRKSMQIIFQDPFSSLNPRQTIGDLIMEPIRVHRTRKTKKAVTDYAEHLLVRVGLDKSHFYRYPHEFSGGQRQRIGIARALALQPEFIICDESVSALDVSVQAQVLNLLNDIKEEFKLTYIFISHDLTVVKYFSDRVAVMKNGRFEEINTADLIYANPQSAYTQKLIQANLG